MSETIFSYLMADHARLHGLLERAMARPELDVDAFAEFRRGLLRHIAIEEKVLLPAVREARGGIAIDRAFELRIDHAALTSLLVPTPDVALCGEIMSFLTEHDAKEEGENGVYDECQRALRPQDLAEAIERAVAFRQIPVVPHFDGPTVHRTAAAALASARRMRAPRGAQAATTEASDEMSPEVDAVASALRSVIDPELGINIVDLGLVYGIDVEPDGVHIRLTMTTAACPLGEQIVREVEARLAAMGELGAIRVELVWDPPWSASRMSAEAKRQLGWG